jgi:hypothetical protein
MKYVLVYYGGGMPATEEERAAVMQAWGAWYTGLGAAVADPGTPFSGAVKSIAADGKVNDGAIGQMASGYTILEADSLDAAVAGAKGCPILQSGGQIAVYETHNMM